MTVFTDQDSEADIVDKVRSTFRAYVPESDAWKKPSFFEVSSIVLGGIAYSAINEARNGIDTRVNAATAVKPYLDIIAATPPLFLTRNNPTKSTGFIEVNCPDMTAIPAGYIFETADGVQFSANDTVTLSAGQGLVGVTSVLEGAAQNSCENQPFEMPLGCTAISRGIFGGFDLECDAQLRRRIFAARSKCYPLGSPQWYENQVGAAIEGITRSWLIQDGGMAKIMFLMEDKYPCGTPLQEDIDALKTHFLDECNMGLCFCPVFCAAKSETIAPEICWEFPPEDIQEVVEEMELWLRNNFDLGEGISTSQIQCFLDDAFPQYEGKIKCCDEYPAKCDVVYNCVEIIGPC